MSTYGSKDVAYVFVHTADIKGYLNTARMKVTATLTDTTGLGDTWQEMTDTGLRTGELEVAGFYDGTSVGTILNTVADTNRIISVLLEGNTVSRHFHGFQSAIFSAVDIGLSPDSVHTSSPTITVRGEVNPNGFVVAPYQTRTTAGNTDTAYADMGADADSGSAYLHLCALTLGGYDNLVVTVRDSDDHITFSDHTAFTAATAKTSEVKALSSTVEQYLSVSWAWTGSGTGQTCQFFVGVAPD